MDTINVKIGNDSFTVEGRVEELNGYIDVNNVEIEFGASNQCGFDGTSIYIDTKTFCEVIIPKILEYYKSTKEG